MHRIFFSFFCITFLVFISCNNETGSSHSVEHENPAHWSYEGETAPEFWAEIEENSDCGGQYQSPINIIETNTVPAESPDNLKIYYGEKMILRTVENNGHSIQFNFKTNDSIIYKEKIYYLKQIHFHVPAEHNINGIKYPLEAHLVHLSTENEITVIGIFGVLGEESQLFELFASFLPLKSGETKEINREADLTKLALESKNYFSYTGSLTTPPCTENVNWIVIQQPLVISLDEVVALKNNMPVNNYRNEQALNGRTVYYNYTEK